MKHTRSFGTLALLLALVMCWSLIPVAAADLPEMVITSRNMADGKLVLKIGETEQLSVTQANSSTPLEGYAYRWSSSEDTVATVGETGLVTAVAPGGATITAEVYEKTDSEKKTLVSLNCDVTVSVSRVAKVTVDCTELSLEKGQESTLAATVTMEPTTAVPEKVTWKSEDTSVVIINSETGKLAAKAPGQAEIVATAGGTSDRCTVTVSGIVLSNTTLNMVSGSTQNVIGYTLYGNAKGKTVTWKGSNNTVATVDETSGKIRALTPGPCTITATTGGDHPYTAECELKISDNTAGVITESVDAGQPLALSDLASDIDSQCRSVLGNRLSYVTNLAVPTSQGILYYGYVSVSDTGSGVGQEKYYVSTSGNERLLDKVTFVPKTGFSGRATITYTGYDTTGLQFGGEIRITVGEADDVVYSTAVDAPVTFASTDFSVVSRTKNGRDVESVTFKLPSERYGTLYYNYTNSGSLGSKVEENTAYGRTRNPYLNNVTFVPAAGYKGTVRISYQGKDASGYTYSGTVTIYVSGSSAGGTGDINYTSSSGKKVTFSASDFNDLSKKLNDENLSYVRFTLPSSSEGTLYYNYSSSSSYDSKVSSNTKYYRSSTPSISKVSFVPKSGFSGTAEVDFTGYDVDGDTFKGVVSIRVRDGGSSSKGDLDYEIRVDEIFTMDATDFNDLCKDETDSNLNYVRFDLPSSSKGVLYYDYKESSGKYDSKVTSSTRYYRNSSKYLNRVTFVPEGGFSGTVDIDFDAWSTGGDTFSGTVTLTVASPQARVIRYSTTTGAVSFLASDFNNACDDVTGRTLDWVKFNLPSSNAGTLYYNYGGINATNTQVRSGTNYYYSGSPAISGISFVPRAGYGGTTSFTYNGADTKGNTFSGTVEIQIAAATVSNVFTDMGGYSWAASAVEFLRNNGVVQGISANQYGPGTNISRGDFALMVCRAFNLSRTGGEGFSDVPSSSYYAAAVNTLQSLEVVQGAGGNYRPRDPISRQDAAVILRGAMRATGWSIGDGDAALLSGFQDGNQVAEYARGAMAGLVELNIFQGSNTGALNPRGTLTRAEMAVILHRALTL